MRSFGAAAALFFMIGILPAIYPSPQEKLEELLDGKGVFREEVFLFAGDGDFFFSGRTAGADGRSVLVIFDKNAGETGEAERIRGGTEEDDSVPEPCVVLALPLGDGTGEDAFDRRCALALIERLSGGAVLPARVIVAFLGERDLRFLRSGGEGSGGGKEKEGPALLPYFLWPELVVLWFLDMTEAPAAFLVSHGSMGRTAPLHVVKNIAALCGSSGIPLIFGNPFNELFLSGLAAGPPALEAILEQDIGGIVLTGTDRQIPRRFHGSEISVDRAAELFFLFATSPPAPVPSPRDWTIESGAAGDYHYRIVSYSGAAFFLSERTLILIFLLAGTVCLMLPRVFLCLRGAFPFSPLFFFRRFPIVALSGVILALSLAVSGHIILFTASLTPVRLPVPVWLLPCLRPALGIGIFILLSLPLRGCRIPRKADFYGAGALFFAVVNILAAAFVNIVLVPLLVEALIILFLGVCFRDPVAVFICAFLAPLHGLFILAFGLLSGNGPGPFLLSTGTADTIRMSLALLPFILMYRRGALVLGEKTAKPESLKT